MLVAAALVTHKALLKEDACRFQHTAAQHAKSLTSKLVAADFIQTYLA